MKVHDLLPEICFMQLKKYLLRSISVENAVKEARMIADEDSEASKKIGEFGQELILNGCNIETHCNAGWLAFVDYGTAFLPIYFAHKSGRRYLFMLMKPVPGAREQDLLHGNCRMKTSLIQ